MWIVCNKFSTYSLLNTPINCFWAKLVRTKASKCACIYRVLHIQFRIKQLLSFIANPSLSISLTLTILVLWRFVSDTMNNSVTCKRKAEIAFLWLFLLLLKLYALYLAYFCSLKLPLFHSIFLSLTPTLNATGNIFIFTFNCCQIWMCTKFDIDR